MYSLFNDFFNVADFDYSVKDDQLSVDLPGCGKDNISVELDNNCLSIKAKRNNKLTYQQKFRISDKVNRDKIRSSYIDGVLSIELPTKESIKPRQLLIE